MPIYLEMLINRKDNHVKVIFVVMNNGTAAGPLDHTNATIQLGVYTQPRCREGCRYIMHVYIIIVLVLIMLYNGFS